MNNFKAALISFAMASLLLWVGALFADWVHPRLPCLEAEKDYWHNRDGTYIFKRVSSFYWSSLCGNFSQPVIISASEGTGKLSFPDAAYDWGYTSHEFTGAHRGLKTAAYLFSNNIHPDRLKKLRALVLINPVYFSFASTTDSSSIRLTALSNLSYILRIPTYVQKWDEFFLTSFFIGAKSYLDELSLFRSEKAFEADFRDGPKDELYKLQFDLERNMLKEKAELFKTFTSPFTSRRQPSRYLFEKLVDFAHDRPEARVCFVMLPTNAKNLRHFGRDTDQIKKEMSELMEMLPEGTGLDLQYMNEEAFIFLDPMHFTDYGKWEVMDQIMNSDCAKRVFE